MQFLLGLVIGAIIGFIGGFLVFRNNQKKLNAAEELAKKLKE